MDTKQKLQRAERLRKTFKFKEALLICEDVLRKDKDNIYAHSIVAACYLDSGAYDKAIPKLAELIRKNPNDVISLTNLSAAMREVSHIDESEKFAMIAYEKDQDHPSTLQNLGQFLTMTGRHAEAKQIYIRLCSLHPESVLGHLALGNALLLEGETEAGLRELETGNILHEAENNVDQNYEGLVPGMYWNGMKMPDQRLLVIIDQGLGDAMQHASRIRTAASKCTGGVIVCGPPEILSLFKHIKGVHSVVENNGLSESYGAFCRISSLAMLRCGREYPPYLNDVEPSHTKNKKPLIGLSWKSRPIPRGRSVPLEFLASELSDLDVDFISLQHEVTEEERTVFPTMMTTNLRNVEDVAQLIASCDAIICIDSLMCHITGAMMKPGLLLIPPHYDYKWGVSETRSTLYPSLEISRQKVMGDWTVPILAARDYVARLIDA